MLVRERTKCEARVGQLVSKVTISCCFPVLSHRHMAVIFKYCNIYLGQGEQVGRRTGGGKAAEQEPQREPRRVAGTSMN